MAKKPQGWRKFDELAKALSKIPKEQVEAAIDAAHKPRKKRKSKKK